MNVFANELKAGQPVILKSGLRCRVQENDGVNIVVTVDGDDDTYAVKSSDVQWARIGAFLVEVKHNSGESK
jgi:preprotein translocase subunit YajC